MNKVLVAYFSVSGVTARAAAEIAEAEGADLFEISPEKPYTKADLDWTDKQSRSTLEMSDLNCRPAISGTVEKMEDYDTVFLGFPIWWGREPSVVDTFLDACDFTGKNVYPFCTSGGGNADQAAERIRALLGKGARVKDGKRIGGTISKNDLRIWTEGLN